MNGGGVTLARRMLDLLLRPWKDSILGLIAHQITLTPTQITLLAFALGLCIPLLSARNHPALAAVFFLLNRTFDGLDGLVARHQNKATELGGFLDIVCDFTVYSLIPLGVAHNSNNDGWATAWLLASFHINNTILFYIAAVMEKFRAQREVTALTMRPALVEGAESSILFLVMLLWPAWYSWVASIMTALVVFGCFQRVAWACNVLPRLEAERSKE